MAEVITSGNTSCNIDSAEDGFKRFRVLFLIKLDECSRLLKIN